MEFLVEVFAPHSSAGELAAAERRAIASARRLSTRGAPVRYLRAMYVPADETCFYVFEALSVDAIQRAATLARLGVARIVEARTSDGGGPK